MSTQRDTYLRRAGFAIHRRPRSGPNIWVRKGEEFPEPEAMLMAEVFNGCPFVPLNTDPRGEAA